MSKATAWILIASILTPTLGCNGKDDDIGDQDDTGTTTEDVDTEAPVITLEGDNPLVMEEGDSFKDPGATVTDNVDTDLEVTVTGKVDANLAGTYVLTYTAVDSAGNEATPVERTVEVFYAGQLAIVPAGDELVLLGLNADGTLIERGTASMADVLANYNDNHAFFGMAKDPGANAIYVTSMNDCSPRWDMTAQSGCWGNGRIDRFTYDVNTITHDGVAYLAQTPMRLWEPTFAKGVLSLTVENQGDSDTSIKAATVDNLGKGMSLTSGCDGTTLAPGETCDLQIDTARKTGLDGKTDLNLLVEASDRDYISLIYWESEHNQHVAMGFTYSDEYKKLNKTDYPGCQLYGFWYPLQHGACALTALAISPDGSRVYVNEDDWDTALTFSLGSEGKMSFLHETDSRSVDYQGMAVNGDNSVVYNGDRTFEVDKQGLTFVNDGVGGNATEVVVIDGVEHLVTTRDNWELGIFSLEDALKPTPLSVAKIKGGARFQHHNAEGTRYAVVDFDWLTILDFDGKDLTEQAAVEIEHTVPCDKCEAPAMSRGVQMTADGSQALVVTMVVPDEPKDLKKASHLGEVTSYAIDAKGTPTLVDNLVFPGLSRSLLFVDTPE